ncbi:Crp/Fnr family transcriptional regulator [Hydrogenimonas urashimensis]|uniref:Crp/Fnr family transcriptional regulator n=1 Tax=Hydrogenimonas urashimensis TaxID=2740515 RepID=UPI0019166358|nr:Crp/Fnr family transcriptional regulator [Hydrogenimonas urashimensis]
MLHLTKLEPFHGLSRHLIDQINRIGVIREYPKGSPAMDSDDTLRHFYILLEGRIKVYRYNPQNNREQTLYLLGPHDMFDVLTVLDGRRHEVMTEAIDHVKALELPIDKVREWLDTNPAFNRAFFPYLARQMRQVEELATDLSLYDTSTRLMKLILKNLDLKNPARRLGLLQNLSHDEIASMIGTVRHVVNRHLQQLKKEGILNIERKKLAVNDVKKLLEKVEEEY